VPLKRVQAIGSAIRTAKRRQYNKTAAARIRAAAEFVFRNADFSNSAP
jgi:hypothetical protein